MSRLRQPRLRHRIATVALLGSAVGCAAASDVALGPIPAGLALASREVRYEVSGATDQQILSDLRKLGPSEGNRRFFGYTSWRIRWRMAVRPVGGGSCALGNVRVTLDLTTTLPRWEAHGPSDAELVEAWEAFVVALRRHESGHGRFAADGARRILERLRFIRGPCNALRREADAIAQGILRRVREQSAEYDRATRHGAEQGARWPPVGRRGS
jgi:predicted secreted Zn-dependent protease